jgi:hypothetical protein
MRRKYVDILALAGRRLSNSSGENSWRLWIFSDYSTSLACSLLYHTYASYVLPCVIPMFCASFFGICCILPLSVFSHAYPDVL